MKKISITIICLLAFVSAQAQSNKDISNVYIKRAYEAIESSVDYTMALTFFEKAMKYRDTILDRRIAILGSSIYYEVHHKRATIEEQIEFLEKSRAYSVQYFALAKNKGSDEYLNNTDTFVVIQESIERLKNKQEKQLAEKLLKEKQLKKIDSLKTIWAAKASELSIKADSIYAFNRDKVALYRSKGFYGVLNDLGEILVEAKEYKDALAFDGFIILKNKVTEPTKLFSFDTNTKIGFVLPSVSDLYTLSTHYGQVMLPRGNGRLVTYPNNSYEPLVYDLKVKKIVKIVNLKEVLKNLKKADVIDKYKKEEEVRVHKNWYTFGGHLGGGIHPLYATDGYNLDGFLCSIDGKLLSTTNDFQYIGYFYNNKSQALSKGKVSWINQNGTKVSAAKDEYGTYSGGSVVIRSDKGKYHILKNNMIVSGAQKLEKLPDYLRKFAPNN